MTLLELYQKISSAGVSIWHYEAAQAKYPYAVYQEYNVSFDYASGKRFREKTRVAITYFSKSEFDETLEKLKTVLLENDLLPDIAITFDREDKTIIYQFEVTLTRNIGG